jgi:hypothetical protein
LPDDVYAVGAKGAAKSNLAYGQDQGATRAVDGWMDDSDKRNIGAVGHRRWALSLEVRVVGFGTERAGESDYSALYVEDTSRVPPRDLPFVVFPARGWMPSDMFSGHHAWSVAVDPIAALRIDTTHLTARVTRLSPDFVPVEETLPIEMSVYETTALAGRHAFIFRPKGLEVVDGAAYLAEVLAPDPKSHKATVLVRWITGFVGEPLLSAAAGRTARGRQRQVAAGPLPAPRTLHGVPPSPARAGPSDRATGRTGPAAGRGRQHHEASCRLRGGQRKMR